MGKPMASNLLAAGFGVTVHSRSAGPVDELVAAGATRAEGPAAVAAASDITITMLPDTADVEQVLTGPGGVIEGTQAGSLVDRHELDRPRADPRDGGGVRRARRRDARRPRERGEKGAIDAALSIMVGGDEAAFARATPVFEALGKNIVHVGPSGAGQVCKACNQLVVAATIEAVAEAMLLAERSGVDAAKVREALLGGFAGSKILEVHGQRMLDRAFDPGFRIRLHRKDARIVEAAAVATDTPIPSFTAVTQQLQQAVDAGDGDRDHSALYAELAREADSPA